jgi:phage tail P2-like protein
MAEDLLPPNSTKAERALAGVSARIDAIPVPIDTLWDADRCPAALLPWLAWSLSVDVWRDDWTEARKRTAIRSALPRHRTKGSFGAVRRALADLGHPDAVIHEGAPPSLYDGSILYGGSRVYAGGGSWAQYAVEIPGGLSAEAYAALGESLAAVAPARCHLISLTTAPDPSDPLYDAAYLYDGAISYA